MSCRFNRRLLFLCSWCTSTHLTWIILFEPLVLISCYRKELPTLICPETKCFNIFNMFYCWTVQQNSCIATSWQILCCSTYFVADEHFSSQQNVCMDTSECSSEVSIHIYTYIHMETSEEQSLVSTHTFCCDEKCSSAAKYVDRRAA